MPCGLDCGGPSGPLTALPCGSRKSEAARIASDGASIVIRLVLTSSLPWLRFLASSISSWQRAAVMMGWTNTFGRSTSLPISSSTLVAFCWSSQSTVLVTAAFTAASSFRVGLCLP